MASMYSAKVMEHFANPHNVGELPDANGVGEVGNPKCGDIMRMYLKIENNVIVDVKFLTFGCGAAIATSSMATDLIKGKTIDEALKLTNKAVAEALGKKLIIWSVKSTTKAQDGLYVYDVVQRLYDSQFGTSGVDDIAKYIKLGKLGEAFSADEQVVLLIDEVDKADLEFPNDLLWELDKMEFYIPETKETIKAKHRPIVIITSNAEKELPDAFLRRCIFHYIEFPDQQQMEKIIRVHFDHVDETLLMQAMQAFYYIRSIDSVEKKPSTSELVDWVRALELTGVDTSRITKEIPFIGVLLKKDKDISTVQRRLRR